MSVQNEQVNKLNPKRQYPVGNCSFIIIIFFNIYKLNENDFKNDT
jgi:hypothetical protein